MDNIKNKSYFITSNFSVKNMVCNGGSKTLEYYEPIFNATVVNKLEEAGALLNQVSMPEFDINTEINDIAIKVQNDGTFGIDADCNGAVRRAAKVTGIIGYKPTYGLISRYGMYAVCSAFDTVGIYANNVKDAALVANTIKGLNPNDMNTWDSSNIDLLSNIDNLSNKKLFFVKELVDEQFKSALQANGIRADEVSIDNELINAIIPVHNTIMNAQMTTTLANLTGIPFGPCGKGKDADEMMINYRNKFESETKSRLIKGTFALAKNNINKFYNNSLRVRHLLFNELNKLFETFDALILPNEEEPRLIANLCGYPSIAIGDILITGEQKNDAKILAIANTLIKEEK